jgi:hypothetical protein
LLNRRTGAVCGILKRSRDTNSDLGGRGIPAATALEWKPALVQLQQDFHAANTTWTDLVQLRRHAAQGANRPTRPHYRTFAVELFDYDAADDGEHFRVRVLSSPAVPDHQHESEKVALSADLRDRLRRLTAPNLARAEMLSLGQELGNLLLPPRARAMLWESRRQLAEHEALRIQLHVASGALSWLPWEYACAVRPGGGSAAEASDNFLVLDRRLSMVRAGEIRTPVVQLRVLGAEAVRLVVVGEDAAPLKQALERVSGIEVNRVADRAGLDAELEGGVHVAHLSSEIWGQSDHSAELVSHLRQGDVRLVILEADQAPRDGTNSVQQAFAQALARGGIPAVMILGMPLGGDNAQVWHERFYRALLSCQPIDAAVAEGRQAMRTRGGDDLGDWGSPVLYLRPDAGDLFPPIQLDQSASTWADLRVLSQRQNERFWRDAKYTPDHEKGAYIEEVYVTRSADGVLEDFLSGSAAALIPLGETGVGKTNLLCRWTDVLTQQGHVVFYYDCGGSLGLDIERVIARDLALADADALPAAVGRIAERGSETDREFVLIFDAVNQFQGIGATGPKDLLRALDALVHQVPERHVRVVISCSSPAWDQLRRQGATRLLWHRYFQPGQQSADPWSTVQDEPALRLDRFTQPEFESAYPRYQEFFHVRWPLNDVPPRLRETLQHPFVLRMLAETYRDKTEPLPQTGLTLDIITEYFQAQAPTGSDERRFIELLIAEMWAARRCVVAVDDLTRSEQVRAEINSRDPESSYQRLRDKGMLTLVRGDDVLQGDLLKFTFPEVGAFALAVLLGRTPGALSTPTDRIELLSTLVAASSSFQTAWSAARILVQLLLPSVPDIFVSLARSPNVELRELAVESLLALPRPTPDARCN